jgi:hypothetical protein
MGLPDNCHGLQQASVFGRTLPPHFATDFIGIIAEVGKGRKILLEQLVGMGLLMLFEGLSEGNEDDVAHVLIDLLILVVVIGAEVVVDHRVRAARPRR